MKAGVQVVGADVHRNSATASFAEALARIFSQRKISAEKFNKQIIGYT